MSWVGRGLIHAPAGNNGWRHQFAMLPTPHIRRNGDLRLFLGFCDPNMVGRVGYVDVDPNDPRKVLRVSERPLLDIGEPGTFDDNGVVPISLVEADGELRLYYIGFQLGVKVPYYMFCGMAVSRDDGETFKRISQSPILDRNDQELYARCGCHVMWDTDRWRMWYVGSVGRGWSKNGEKLVPHYTVRHVESENGIDWTPSVGVPCVEFQNEDEHGFGRPFVRKTASGYEMLLSVRTYSRGYYLSRATSKDGLQWTRQSGPLVIDRPVDSVWDSENTSYAHTVALNGRDFLFYNGNGCGKSGVGFAEWVE